jgi:hypothetical protein
VAFLTGSPDYRWVLSLDFWQVHLYNGDTWRVAAVPWRISSPYAEKVSHSFMTSIQPNKVVLSTIVTLLLLGCFVFIDTGPKGILQGPLFNDSDVVANAFKWGFIIFFGIIWVLIQVFMEAPAESSRLSLAVSGSILWLGLVLFYHFADPAYGGPVAFFALVGGLLVVIVWTHYLADEF